MGQVWAATHTVTLRTVALKLLSGAPARERELRLRFLREARAASAVVHPNVVRIHDCFELEDGTPVMVMDLLDGETLAQKLAREHVLPLAEAASLLLPVVSAVGSAHAVGVIHRDLKPDNVFLARSPSGQGPGGASGGVDVRVLDFGIAKLVSLVSPGAAPGDSAGLTDTGAVLGTPCYMSPEQCFGEKDVDHRTDIWAIGAMLYEALAGMRPVDGDGMGQIIKKLMVEGITPLETVAPDVPAEVAELVRRMLAKDRGGRPRDLREVSAVLARHATGTGPALGGA
jgi:serine/threonine-protein kinase